MEKIVTCQIKSDYIRGVPGGVISWYGHQFRIQEDRETATCGIPESVAVQEAAMGRYKIIGTLSPATETPKETTAPAKDYATLQAERMKAFQNMTSEQRQTAFREEIEQEMNLPEDMRRDMVRDRVSAIRNMDQGVLHEYMRAWGEAFRGMRGGGPPGGGPPGGGPP